MPRLLSIMQCREKEGGAASIGLRIRAFLRQTFLHMVSARPPQFFFADHDEVYPVESSGDSLSRDGCPAPFASEAAYRSGSRLPGGGIVTSYTHEDEEAYRRVPFSFPATNRIRTHPSAIFDPAPAEERVQEEA